MAGLYIHIPFCRQKCVYCDFMSGTNAGLSDRYIRGVCREISRYEDFFDNDALRTVYFGGGTPSMLSVSQMSELCEGMGRLWNLGGVEEWTVECNPDDITEEWLCGVRALGINRLSIGVQSFNDEELRWMGRRHDAAQARRAVGMARAAGFDNISIDIMFALPVQSIDSLNRTLDGVEELDVRHVSAYSLMFEEGSKLERLMRLERVRPLADEVAAEMFDLVARRLSLMGFEQYEISNYAKRGYESLHNSGYWRYQRFLGIGAAAYSFDGECRWSNIGHTLKYLDAIERDTPVNTVERLTEDEHYNEYLFTALRTREGLDLRDMAMRFGDTYRMRTERIAAKFIGGRLMTSENGRIALTKTGIYISDSIMSDFMIV